MLNIIAVKPRWVYNNNNADNSKTRSLPDFIEFDLQLGSGKITLNLTKQSAESAGPLLTITQSVGQSSIWKHREEVSCPSIERLSMSYFNKI